ncbi:MAG: Plug domain-containing protein [Chromatiales bacterium]|nr:Plug domain-containing protein [Chromatiales bacterium]
MSPRRAGDARGVRMRCAFQSAVLLLAACVRRRPIRLRRMTPVAAARITWWSRPRASPTPRRGSAGAGDRHRPRRRSSAARPATSPNCCASTPASTSAATAAPARPTAVFIRGAESNHTLVLVDGVRINPGHHRPRPALQNILPRMIERIEVVKGPRSALYGTRRDRRRDQRDHAPRRAGRLDRPKPATATTTRAQASLNGGFGHGAAVETRPRRRVARQRRLPDPHDRRHRPRLREPERARRSCAPTLVPAEARAAALARRRARPSTRTSS